jgi:hypothetical protein
MTVRLMGPVPPSLLFDNLPPFQGAPPPWDTRRAPQGPAPVPEWIEKNPATTYSPTQLPEQYHRHGRA